MYVRYRGPLRGMHMLVRDLRDAGFDADFEPPLEQRGAEQDALEVVIWVAKSAASSLVGPAVIDAATQVARGFVEQHPGVEVDVETDEEQREGAGE